MTSSQNNVSTTADARSKTHRRVRGSITRGFSRARAQWPLAVLLWGVNLLFAIGLTLPMYRLLDGSLSFSLDGDRSHVSPDVQWLAGFLFYHRDALSGLAELMRWGMGCYMVFTALVSAGVVEVLLASSRFSFRRFVEGIARHGPRFLRLFVVSVFVYSVIFWLFQRVLTEGWWIIGGLDRWTKDWMAERAVFALYLAKNIVFGIVLLFAVMVFDYARIGIVLEPERGVRGATRKALGFVGRNLGATHALFYGVGAVSGVAMALYLCVERWLPGTMMSLVLAGLVWGQCLMLARSWLRVALTAAEIDFYSDGMKSPSSPSEG